MPLPKRRKREGKRDDILFPIDVRLNEAFVRREYELRGIQVTRNIAMVASGRANLSLAVEDGERTECTSND